MNSSFLLCYALFGIFSGHLADRYRKNLFIFVAYSAIGANVILVGCQQYFNHQQTWLYFVLRIIDGTLQSIGWATNLAVLSNWFPKHGRGLLIGCWASNTNVGDIIGA
jgi:MFS transporter, OPA family, solute carrier family 37 (glycerol-3-phosphate transporter), member 3